MVVRPVGVTVLGGLVVGASIVLMLIGIAGFIVGLAFLIPVTPISGTTLLLNGLLYFFIGLVLGISGAGLLSMRAWAWGLGILASLVYLVYLGYNLYQETGTTADCASNRLSCLPLNGVLAFTIVALVFVYLLSVTRAFRRPQRAF